MLPLGIPPPPIRVNFPWLSSPPGRCLHLVHSFRTVQRCPGDAARPGRSQKRRRCRAPGADAKSSLRGRVLPPERRFQMWHILGEVCMKRVSPALALIPLLAAVLPAQRPWQQITVPSVRDVAANFKAPPREYGAIQPFASWNGPDARERMVQDFDRLAANGIFVVNMSPGRGEPKYLSPEHVSQVKFAVQEAAKRGMKLWIQDESDYPSGFAGGNISRQYPQLAMQGIVADIRVRVIPGQTLSMPAPPDTLAIFATKTSTDQKVQGVVNIPVPANGRLKWTVPAEGSTPNEPR